MGYPPSLMGPYIFIGSFESFRDQVFILPYQKRVDYEVNINHQFYCLSGTERIRKIPWCPYRFKLSWNQHIAFISSKISKSLRILSILRRFVLQTVLLNIYQSLIQSHLSYGVAAYSPGKHHYSTRSSVTSNLYLKHARTENAMKTSFSRLGVGVWNSILICLCSKYKFKDYYVDTCVYIPW
ncbi:hypothetical protein pdam_00002499 [Pocillopora damicornis]|uniref:Uncharacterized protein n=1 Tax=Pocillopora damicornis TaxID=46731 RepID=A0A3M6TS74_POCDA|nr:hypothetical protein pdam_00002499 [Pocillopora damicornis]